MSTATFDVGERKWQLSREQIITYVITLLGLGMLVYSAISFNNWRLVDPRAIAEARVAREDGLSRAQQTQLYQRQFDQAVTVKSRFGQQGLIFLVFGVLVLYLSRHWQKWRQLGSEHMLYAYAFLLPPLGWVLYLFAYQTRGNHNRELIRRNIGIMSLSLIAGGVAFYLFQLLQVSLLQPLYTPDPNATTVLSALFGFLVSVQLAQFVGIAVGGYVAFLTRDVRALAVAAQLVVLFVVLSIFSWFAANAQIGLDERGIDPADFTFIDLTSGFDIAETLIAYDRNSTYGQAFLVGALNTVMVSSVGIVLASLLGLLVGVARLSTNWLTSTIARVFVELMRNVPLLVLLFFLYAGVLLQLPTRDNTLNFLGGNILLNNRGVALTWPAPTDNFDAWIPFLIVGFLAGVITWFFRNRTLKSTGRPAFNFGFVLLAFASVPVIGIFVVNPLMIQVPFIDGLNYAKTEDDRFVGLVMSPQFFGLLAGLVLYTGGYIGEVVRAGIQSVSRGQREAATALGLTTSQNMQLIILPQALRVIVPPLTNQYLNLTKNSSLAIAIGYADLYFVANTTFNQSGQSVQVVLMIMASYLAMSLFISAGMNFINGRIQIKER